MIYRLLAWLLLCLPCCGLAAQGRPAVALFYGPQAPLDELRAFDVSVVEPDQPGLDPKTFNTAQHQLFAYVSLGEVQPAKPYYADIPKAWLKGRNEAWGSRLIDQSAEAWPAFVAEHIIAPLWARGYRGFFLDTLDSYQLLAKSPAARAAPAAGLKAAIREIKRRWPEARLIFNRGFEILPELHALAWMVAAESLYQGWDAKAQRYVEVGEADRRWLLAQLQGLQRDYGLPVLVIDYLPVEQRALARRTADRIRELGFIPWVSTARLDSLGVGEVEVIPRKVLVIYDPEDEPIPQITAPVRYLGMPLAYLGLVMELRSVREALPGGELAGRYAGIVSWLSAGRTDRGTDYPQWLQQQVEAGLPVAIFEAFGFGPGSGAFVALGLRHYDDSPSPGMKIVQQHRAMGFELPLRPRPEDTYPVSADKSQPWLSFSNGRRQYHSVAITPWGGFALAPYAVENLPGKDQGERWYLNPLLFLRAALRLDERVPVPDVSTELGRRLLLVHVDGDAFMSKVERPGYPLAGEVLRDEVLKRYRLPTTVSIIEAEISPKGLYPELAPRLERTAREIFALPHVQLASHSFSHPFNWFQQPTKTGDEDGYRLPVKGYAFNLKREIDGSVRYINQRLAPPGKRVQTFLWTGNCMATPEALATVQAAGVFNMNGGDTTITQRQNSWTRIAGLGAPLSTGFQVFAPNQNENIYTNLWSGPFYGYERVLETFELTESPYRFKPVNIYYHFYAVTKTASLNALHKVYRWAEQQPLHPVHAVDYIRKVLDFNTMVVARTPGGFRVRGQGQLRNLRLPAQGAAPSLARSQGVAGLSPGPSARYISLSGASAELIMGEDRARLPFIESANARLSSFERQARGLRFGLDGHVPLRLTLANAQGCRLYQGRQSLIPARQDGGRLHYELSGHEGLAFRLDCGA